MNPIAVEIEMPKPLSLDYHLSDPLSDEAEMHSLGGGYRQKDILSWSVIWATDAARVATRSFNHRLAESAMLSQQFRDGYTAYDFEQYLDNVETLAQGDWYTSISKWFTGKLIFVGDDRLHRGVLLLGVQIRQ